MEAAELDVEQVQAELDVEQQQALILPHLQELMVHLAALPTHMEQAPLAATIHQAAHTAALQAAHTAALQLEVALPEGCTEDLQAKMALTAARTVDLQAKIVLPAARMADLQAELLLEVCMGELQAKAAIAQDQALATTIPILTPALLLLLAAQAARRAAGTVDLMAQITGNKVYEK